MYRVTLLNKDNSSLKYSRQGVSSKIYNSKGDNLSLQICKTKGNNLSLQSITVRELYMCMTRDPLRFSIYHVYVKIINLTFNNS
jgi:hypothetical protein